MRVLEINTGWRRAGMPAMLAALFACGAALGSESPPAASSATASASASSAVAPAASPPPARPARPTAEPPDTSEIAARAVSSALAAQEQQGEEPDELAVRAYDAVARDLAQRIAAIEKEYGKVARQLEVPLTELAKLYVSADQCQSAIPILKQTIALSQRLDGVMSPKQLPLYEPLLECYIAREALSDLHRAQEQMLQINENAFGREDPRMLPALAHAGDWFEQAGDYQGARDAHSRALRIARKAGGEQSLDLVAPLRALARTYRLEMQYEPEAWRGRALDAQGQRLLERAAKIVRAGTPWDSKLRIETLVDLGDWYQMAGTVRDAARIYQEVVARSGAAALLREPMPIVYRAAVGVALRRPPPDRTGLKHYWIDFEYTVNRFGEVQDVVVEGATAPRDLQLAIAENLRRTRYRPRFEEGRAVDTAGVKVRQGVWAER
jgi:tetratricopeptide (TPR) repeat protein